MYIDYCVFFVLLVVNSYIIPQLYTAKQRNINTKVFFCVRYVHTVIKLGRVCVCIQETCKG